MQTSRLLLIAMTTTLAACSQSPQNAAPAKPAPKPVAAKPAPAPRANPLMSESTLPFHAPPFDKIKDSDYQPAIEAGMKQQLAEIDKIANDPSPPTFENTNERTPQPYIISSGRVIAA